jgi:hypothetical protein
MSEVLDMNGNPVTSRKIDTDPIKAVLEAQIAEIRNINERHQAETAEAIEKVMAEIEPRFSENLCWEWKDSQKAIDSKFSRLKTTMVRSRYAPHPEEPGKIGQIMLVVHGNGLDSEGKVLMTLDQGLALEKFFEYFQISENQTYQAPKTDA